MTATPQFPRTQRVGILVFNDFEPLDVWGFIEAFSISRFVGTGYDSPAPFPFETVLISNEVRNSSSGAQPGPVKSMNGPRVAPDLFRDEALTQPIDVLMIPGGEGVGDLLRDAASLDALVAWVRGVRSEHFAYSCVHMLGGSKWGTITDSECLDPVSETTGGRKYSFANDDGTYHLFKNLYTREGRHDYVEGSGVVGPNVFVDSRADNTHADVGPHHR